MGYYKVALLFVTFGLFCVHLSDAQFELMSWFAHVGEPEGNDEKYVTGACVWEESPDNGYSFSPCSTGVCRGVPGGFKRNGTIRFTLCDKYYVLGHGSNKDLCKNGTWTSSRHKCIPCGRSQGMINPVEDRVLMNYAQNSSRGDFPWMAAVYAELDTGKWSQICGGTLISPKMVLTAAHCLKFYGNDLKPENLRVGLGKLFRDIYIREPSSVVSGVSEVLKPEPYVGLDHLYSLDIAILVLEEPVATSKEVMPACLDWKASMGPKNDEAGILAGWGVTDDGDSSVRSPILKWALQKYIDYGTCRDMINARDKKYVTFDKFCIEDFKGSRANKGDSGGGLMFVRNGIYYTYGIVSTKMRNEEKNLRMFTNLLTDIHRAWILKVWRKQHETKDSGCTSDKDCEQSRSCEKGQCVDPCRSFCGDNTLCDVITHIPVCACKPGFFGNPLKSCVLEKDKRDILDVDKFLDSLYEQVEGDVCKQEGGALWSCKVQSDCPKAVVKTLQNGEKPEYCNPMGNRDDPLVCCEPWRSDRTPRWSQSKTMCKRYAKAVRGACHTHEGDLEPWEWWEVKPKEAPYWALLTASDFDNWCHGSLISERYIIASGYCLSLNSPMRTARLGAHYVNGKARPDQAADYDVLETIYHPDYRHPNVYHGLGLVKLGSAVKFTDHIRPICLHIEHVFPESYVAVIGNKNKVLHKENTTVMTRKECQPLFEGFDTLKRGVLDESMMCVEKHGENNVAVYNGMPLYLELEEPSCSLGLVGLSSFYNDIHPETMGYLRISYYLPWIESVVWPNQVS